jgi:hypothetical protein
MNTKGFLSLTGVLRSTVVDVDEMMRSVEGVCVSALSIKLTDTHHAYDLDTFDAWCALHDRHDSTLL